jgi:hypothetical protein
MKTTMQRLASRLRAWAMRKLDLAEGQTVRTIVTNNERLRQDVFEAGQRISRLYEELDKTYDLRSLPVDFFKADVMDQPVGFTTMRVSPKQAAINLALPPGCDLLRTDGRFASEYALRLADCFGYPCYASIMQQLGHQPMSDAEYKARPRRSW